MKISVIIPAYNIAEFLPRCLNSLLAQTHKELEIIVVNDGSSDTTAAVIDDYASRHPQITALHKQNGGVTSARLAGINAATGEYIGFVDGDDFAEPDMFERMLCNALEYNADISHCGYRMVFPDGRVDYYYNKGLIILQNTQSGLADLISGEFVEPGLWNKLFKKELFEKASLGTVLDRSIKINEDLLMNYYLFKASQTAVYEDFCPYHYILRENSASTAKSNPHKLDDPIKVTRIIAEDASEDYSLSGILTARLARQLISLASMPKGEQKELIAPRAKKAQRELHELLPVILKQNELSLKLKAMAVWAAFCPSSYCMIHSIYAKITGIDKKYKLN